MIAQAHELSSIEAVFNHPSIKDDVWDGGIPKKLPVSPSIYYLLAKEERFSDGAVEDIVIGAMMFVPMNSVTWNPHIAVYEEHRGLGTEVLKEGMKWMFENTPCVKLVAYPPAFNKAMIRVFEKCEWKNEGYSPASFMWRGALHDRVMFGTGK